MEAKLPFNLNLEEHILMHPTVEYMAEFSLDHAKYLLTQITAVPASNKDIEDEMQDGFVPLSSKVIQNRIHRYSRYFKYFEDTGVIDIDHKYRPSIFFQKDASCKRYRFTEHYQKGDIISVTYSPRFCRVLEAALRRQNQEFRKEYGHLMKWLAEDNKLEIDYEQAIRYLDVRKVAQIKNPELRDIKITTEGRKIRKRPKDQYKHAKFNADSIVNKESRCIIDQVAGRLHSVLTNIKKDLRNLITYDGQTLVSIDITNSQPYFAAALLDKEFYQKNEPKTTNTGKIGRIRVKDIKQEIRKGIRTNKDNSTLMLVFGSDIADNENVIAYKNIVSSQNSERLEDTDFYNYILRASKSGHLNCSFANRDDVKIGMFEVLFSKNKRQTKAKKLFSEIFPEVAELFRWIKDGPHEKDYTRLACLLQNIEAIAILKVITKQLSIKYPRMPMFTVHDSIVVPKTYQEQVKKFMHESLTELVGLPPRLTVDEWLPSNLKWEKYQS